MCNRYESFVTKTVINTVVVKMDTVKYTEAQLNFVQDLLRRYDIRETGRTVARLGFL
jgi:hypothetical protein